MKIFVKARTGITVPTRSGRIGDKAVPVEKTPFISARLADGDLIEVAAPAAAPQTETPPADGATAVKSGRKK